MKLSNTWRSAAALTVALIGAASLSGCIQEVPVVSRESGNPTTNMTLDEQRAWVAAQFDEAVDATGVSEGWHWGSDTVVSWDANAEHRETILGSWFPRSCSAGGKLVESLRFKDTVADPAATAAAVRAFWESEGWVVTDVREDAANRDPYIRADREDGAGLGFQASDLGMSLTATSACSVNNTVTNWQDHVGTEATAFEEELDRKVAEHVRQYEETE